jgi:hypothetical protein
LPSERLAMMNQLTVPAPVPTAGQPPPDSTYNYDETTLLRSRLNNQVKHFFLDQNGDGLPDAVRLRSE